MKKTAETGQSDQMDKALMISLKAILLEKKNNKICDKGRGNIILVSRKLALISL